MATRKSASSPAVGERKTTGARKTTSARKTAAAAPAAEEKPAVAPKTASPRKRTATAKKTPAPAAPPPEHVREAAYYRWLERGCPVGDPNSDWLEAEKQLRGGK